MRRKLLALMEKHRRIAEAGRAAATRKKVEMRLPLPLVWLTALISVHPAGAVMLVPLLGVVAMAAIITSPAKVPAGTAMERVEALCSAISTP